ncbi:MAG: hypothetical protein HQ562_03410 [Candidatus Marinimicrobia bacterium]|nr:hypothetical protein [Candidatus Neomarinimicrobiota bacterium]
MSDPITLAIAAIRPSDKAVLQEQGVDKSHSISPAVRDLVIRAMDSFSATANPVAIMEELSVVDFAGIYHGEGQNDSEASLKDIFPRADRMALFALTIGLEISNTIENLLSGNDIALGYTLDTVASLAADNAAGLLGNLFSDRLLYDSKMNGDNWVLGYSPGYCGWHISGQKKLFQHLKPYLIGISLNDSYLMQPLKSVTGVLIAGNKEIHRFKPNFTFCRACRTKSCHARLRALNIERNE